MSSAEAQIRAKVRAFLTDETRFGVFSTGERIAVAVVLDRYDLLQRAWGTIAESMYRLGDEWTTAALRVQRNGWDQPPTI
jgi:sigma54-dependent transcription regulator